MLAYLHLHFSGFVPCKVVRRITADKAEVKLTANRGPWKRGELILTHPSAIYARPLHRSRQSLGKLWSVTADISSVPQS